LASKNPKKLGSLIPLIVKRLLSSEKDEKGVVVKVIRNLSDSYTAFNIKVLKEIVFYCKECVRNNLEDILIIIKLLSA